MALRMDRRVSDVAEASERMNPGWQRWGLGVVAALLLVGYGVRCLLRGEAYLPGRHGGMTLAGAQAVAMAIAYIGLGAFLHFRFVWEGHPRLWPFAPIGKLASLLAFVGGLGYVLVRLLVLS